MKYDYYLMQAPLTSLKIVAVVEPETKEYWFWSNENGTHSHHWIWQREWTDRKKTWSGKLGSGDYHGPWTESIDRLTALMLTGQDVESLELKYNNG